MPVAGGNTVDPANNPDCSHGAAILAEHTTIPTCGNGDYVLGRMLDTITCHHYLAHIIIDAIAHVLKDVLTSSS